MNTVLWLLVAQCLLGAYDTLWHHEIRAKLPSKRAARRELALHSGREFLYAIVFLGLAWREWRGLWAWALGGILTIEVLLTLADFVEEDRTRRLPRAERVVHTLLAVNYGVWLGVVAPHLVRWSRLDTVLAPADYGGLSVVLTAAATGVFVWSLRNLYAVLKHARPPGWVRTPFHIRRDTRGRTILVTGGTGFIGYRLIRSLLAGGDAVIVLTRERDKALDLFGPHVRVVETLAEIDADTRVDAIVNLAGASILALPWSQTRRRILLASRIVITRELVRLCQRLRKTPRVLVSGSAIGYYGARADEECDEFAQPQSPFQSDLCRQWETSAAAASSLGVRVVLLRTGLVLDSSGGMLPRMSLPIRLFAGAVLNDGQQWMSWIHIDDAVRMIEFALDRTALAGPLNVSAPKPVKHAEFQRSLARQLRRPLALRVPGWVVRRILGEMSELLIHGQRVIPRKSGVHGFRFRYPTLKPALESLFPSRSSISVGEVTRVYFNGECPVCNKEMTHYARLAGRASPALCFVDSIREPQAFSHYGLLPEHLEKRLYVLDARGNVVSGLPAILQVWRQLPVYRQIARVVALPVVRQLAVAAYDLLIAPMLAAWARRRMSAVTASERLS